jgi:predicted RNA binding protein YcfA (HicA-like mRNA interferase family)
LSRSERGFGLRGQSPVKFVVGLVERFMPRKIRDYKAEIAKLGFEQKRGKGSHQNWKHPKLRLLITIAFKDGEDVPLYLEKLLQKATQELATIEEESDE